MNTDCLKGVIRGIWTYFCFMSVNDLLDGGRETPSRPSHWEFSWGIHMEVQEVGVHDCVVGGIGGIIAKLRGER